MSAQGNIPGGQSQHAVTISAILICLWVAGNGAQHQPLPQNQVCINCIWTQPRCRVVSQCDVVSL